MKDTLQRHTDGTIELLVTVPWKTIKVEYDKVLSKTIASIELPGFRKGKAPRKRVEETVDKTKLYEDVLRSLLPDVYNTCVSSHTLKPIVSPKVELKEAKQDTDWVIRIVTCEKPHITLGDYKNAIAQAKNAKRKKIWVPGQEEEKKDEEKESKPTIGELLDAMIPTITISIPALLIEEQVNKMLSQLIEQTRKLGLSVEQYLSSSGKTSASIRKEYETDATRTLTLEFALEQIADEEGIIVGDDDIETVIKSAKTDEEKKQLEKDRYYIASVLRRQKTLEFLSSL